MTHAITNLTQQERSTEHLKEWRMDALIAKSIEKEPTKNGGRRKVPFTMSDDVVVRVTVSDELMVH